jgi:hypothetical protein
MKTLALSVALIVCGFVVSRVSLTLLNIAGLPGALIAWGTSDKARTTGGVVRFALGVMISMIGQLYVYLAWVGVIVNFVKHESGAVLAAVIWPVAFIAAFFPVYFCGAAAAAEAGAGESEWNPQVYAILYTEIGTVIGFFIFAFFPKVVAVGWPWITYVSYWLGWQ